MTPEERWLTTMWPMVSGHLPPSPAGVLEIGCGSLGGFVPTLSSAGYDAIGIDPEAPVGHHYRQSEFEHADIPQPVDAVVASLSLHHVSDPALVLDRVRETLTHGGAVVVVEWAWERFDERTAAWCFERLGDDEEGWLHRGRDRWLASGKDWTTYISDWAEEENLHSGATLIDLLDERFERRLFERAPYFFPSLHGVTQEDELAAIDTGEIRACRIDWVGRA